MNDRTCKVEGCERKHLARGYCSIHYQRCVKKGYPEDYVPLRDRVMPDDDEVKRCSYCGAYKPHSEFGKDARRSDGRYPYCKPCARTVSKGYRDRRTPEQKAWQQAQSAAKRAERDANDKLRAEYLSKGWVYALKRRYGITSQQWLGMFEAQGGVCAICGEDPTQSTGTQQQRRLHVDHDHATGAVRGLLCFKCNSGLGRFNDSAALLARAGEYLAHPPGVPPTDASDPTHASS